LLAMGIETGHGRRDYLIDRASGDSKAITPEGTAGTNLSADGRSIAVLGPDGKWGIWSLEGSGLKPIPGLDSKFVVVGWTPDGTSLYVGLGHREATPSVSRVNIETGKVEPWKTFGTDLPTGATRANWPLFSSDGSAYVYSYFQQLSQGYVVKGLK